MLNMNEPEANKQHEHERTEGTGSLKSLIMIAKSFILSRRRENRVVTKLCGAFLQHDSLFQTCDALVVMVGADCFNCKQCMYSHSATRYLHSLAHLNPQNDDSDVGEI